MKSTLLIILAFIFINNVKAQGVEYQPIAYQTEKDWKNLIAKKQDEEIKNRKNTIYGSVGIFGLGGLTTKINLQRKILNFLSLKSSIGGLVHYYGYAFIYEAGPIVSLEFEKYRLISGVLLYGIIDDDPQHLLAIPIGFEFIKKRGFYLSPQFIFLGNSSGVGFEIQLGMGVSF